MVMITPYDRASMNGDREVDPRLRPRGQSRPTTATHPGHAAAATEQRRKEYIKLAKNKAEDARISVRGARRTAKEALDKMVKDKEVGEDEVARAEKQLDAATKKHTDAIDDVLKHKEAELLEV